MNDFKDSPAAYWVAVGRGVLKEDILAAVESQAQEVQGTVCASMAGIQG